MNAHLFYDQKYWVYKRVCCLLTW